MPKKLFCRCLFQVFSLATSQKTVDTLEKDLIVTLISFSINKEFLRSFFPTKTNLRVKLIYSIDFKQKFFFFSKEKHNDFIIPPSNLPLKRWFHQMIFHFATKKIRKKIQMKSFNIIFQGKIFTPSLFPENQKTREFKFVTAKFKGKQV